jgi:hypothetical protein
VSNVLVPIVEATFEELLLARAARGEGETWTRRSAGIAALDNPHVV